MISEISKPFRATLDARQRADAWFCHILPRRTFASDARYTDGCKEDYPRRHTASLRLLYMMLLLPLRRRPRQAFAAKSSAMRTGTASSIADMPTPALIQDVFLIKFAKVEITGNVKIILSLFWWDADADSRQEATRARWCLRPWYASGRCPLHQLYKLGLFFKKVINM